MPHRSKLLVGLLTLGAFSWGALSVRYQVFPYRVLASALSVFESAPADKPEPRGPRAGRVRTTHDVLDEIADAPYLQGHNSAVDAENVSFIDLERAQPGLNLVLSGHRPEARLQDLKGNTLHVWEKPFEEVWPAPLDFKTAEFHKLFWRRAHVFPNGDLLAIHEAIGMLKLNTESELLWQNQGRYHHDIDVIEDGTIYTLSRWWRTKHPGFPLEGAIEEDFIAVLSADGEELRRFSILDALLDSEYSSILNKARRKGDLLHTNTIEVMDGRFAERHPMFARGNLLISIRELNTVAVVDPQRELVIWALSGLWAVQHQPTILDDGRMLVFDNLGARGKSRVLELDPLTQEILWSYQGAAEDPLFSKVIGSSQRLANGNTLITESVQSRALEVTRGGEIVWEYYNPYRTEDDLVAWLCEVVRLDTDYFDESFEPARQRGGEIDLQGLDAVRGK